MLTPVAEKKLFLLDAFALIYRAYFAFAKNPRVNSKGQNTSAAFGFTNALIDVIQKEQPTHLAVVFDAPGGATNRTADYEHYKANRDEMPEDIRSMIEPIKRILEAFQNAFDRFDHGTDIFGHFVAIGFVMLVICRSVGCSARCVEYHSQMRRLFFLNYIDQCIGKTECRRSVLAF